MMMIRLLLASLLLAGCGVTSSKITGDATQVSFKSGAYTNPGGEAEAHCRGYGKSAALLSFQPTDAMGAGVYRFACQ